MFVDIPRSASVVDVVSAFSVAAPSIARPIYQPLSCISTQAVPHFRTAHFNANADMQQVLPTASSIYGQPL